MFKKNKHRRFFKNYLINPSLQLRFSFNFVVAFLVAMATIYGFLFYKMNDFIKQFNLSYPIQSKFHLQLHDLLHQLMLTTIATIGILTLSVFAIAIFYSHKIAGPAYVIKSSIEKMIAGDFNLRKGLREGDELEEVAEALSRLAKEYESKIKSEK